jgi:hypothetical protein
VGDGGHDAIVMMMIMTVTVTTTMANVNSITTELNVYRHVHHISQLNHMLTEMGLSHILWPCFFVSVLIL